MKSFNNTFMLFIVISRPDASIEVQKLGFNRRSEAAEAQTVLEKQLVGYTSHISVNCVILENVDSE